MTEYAAGSVILDLPGHCDSRVMRCHDCSMMFLCPYLSEEELAGLYSASYFSDHNESAHTIAPEPVTTYCEAVAVRVPKFETTLNMLSSLISPSGSLLDVGAGTGDFVRLARARGFRADGLEFSAFAVAQARDLHGLDLIRGRLDDLKAPRQYEAIHLNHVLEHIPDPNAALRLMSDLLTPHGAIYVEVPFQFNIVEQVKRLLGRGNPPFSLHSLHHALFFTPRTLLMLFANHGFECISFNLFDFVHYPLSRPLARVKAAAWWILAKFGQGLFIEAVFRRR